MMSSRDGWRRARLETILDLSLAIAGQRRESEVVDELVQRAVGMVDARAGLALSLSPRQEPATVSVVGWPIDREAATRLVADPRLLPMRSGEVVRLGGEELDLPFTEVLLAPCLWREEMLGLVALADREARGGVERFDEEDVTFLRSLALLAAPVMILSVEQAHVDGPIRLGNRVSSQPPANPIPSWES